MMPAHRQTRDFSRQPGARFEHPSSPPPFTHRLRCERTATMARSVSTSTQSLTSLDDLELDDRPANKGTPRGRAALAESIRTFGAGRSIVVDRAGRVIAGNKVLTAAKDLDLSITVV